MGSAAWVGCFVCALGAWSSTAAASSGGSRALTLAELVGTTPRVFEPSGEPQHPGFNHLALYRVDGPRGPRLIKVTASLPDDPHDEDDFAAELAGQRLAAEHGGAAIHDAGRVILGDGRPAHFIDMELLFPDDPGIFSLKGVLYAGPRPLPLTAAHLDTLTRRTMTLLEKKICANDIDAIFSPGGDVRWIDASSWRVGETASLNHRAFGLATLMGFVGLRGEDALHELSARLRREIARSRVWDEAMRVVMLGLLQKHLTATERMLVLRRARLAESCDAALALEMDAT